MDDISSLIVKDFSDEISPEEKRLLTQWLEQDQENMIYYKDMKKIHDHAGQLKSWQAFDTDAAWRRLKAKLLERETKQENHNRKIQLTWRIAASIVLIVSMSIIGYRQLFFVTDEITLVTQSEKKQESLPDGTRVLLNQNSLLQYSFQRGSNTRQAKLTGEAFFTISSADDQFLLEVDQVFIKDIGTAFNVKANPADSLIEVYVESGEVSFYTTTNPGIQLVANETGVYNKYSKTFSFKRVPDINVLAYKTGVFVFQDARLADVVAAINEAYPTKLKLDNEQAGNCRITVKFNQEVIEMIAEVLASTLNLTIEKKENQIILKGNECAK